MQDLKIKNTSIFKKYVVIKTSLFGSIVRGEARITNNPQGCLVSIEQ